MRSATEENDHVMHQRALNWGPPIGWSRGPYIEPRRPLRGFEAWPKRQIQFGVIATSQIS